MNNPDLSTMSEEEAFAAGLADDAPAAEGATPVEPAAATPAAGQADDETAQGGLDTSENAAQPPPEDEWLATLPEDIRNRVAEAQSANRKLQEELAQARNDHASMAGKLRPLQQKLAKLESASPAAPPAPPANVPQPQTAEELAALLNTPEFEEWSQTFPEEAKVWKANNTRILEVAEKIAERQVTKAVQALTTRLDPIIGKVELQQKTEDYNARISELQAAHPDWQQYNESDDFSNWFDNVYLPAQPDVIQKQFEDPAVVARSLSQPKFASRMLTEFKRDRGITPVQAPPAQAAPAKPATPARLAMSVTPTIGATPPVSRIRLDLMTPEQAFIAGLKSPD